MKLPITIPPQTTDQASLAHIHPITMKSILEMQALEKIQEESGEEQEDVSNDEKQQTSGGNNGT